jgi:hypothetical protein
LINGLQFNGVAIVALLLVGVWRVTVLAVPAVCFGDSGEAYDRLIVDAADEKRGGRAHDGGAELEVEVMGERAVR